jgi:hypothetical protein
MFTAMILDDGTIERGECNGVRPEHDGDGTDNLHFTGRRRLWYEKSGG